MQQDECALCGARGPLVDGHLIPDFAVRRLRDDSPTPYFRGHNPNVRIQGGRRIRLLCATCDNNRFSDAESSFAARIFHPFLNGERFEFDCMEIDRYFIASLIWRGVVSRLRDHGKPNFTYTREDILTAEHVISDLRAYLLGERAYPEQIEQHIFFSGPTGEGQFPGLNTYLTMANDLQVVGSDSGLYFYSILSGVIVISPLRLAATKENLWLGGTLVRPGAAICAHDQTIADAEFGSILATFAATLRDGKASLSQRQRARLNEALGLIDKGTFAQSRHGQALIQDYLNERANRDDEV